MPSPGRVIRPAADEASEGSSSTYISSCKSVNGDLSKLDGKRAGAAETLNMVIEKYSDAVKISAFPKKRWMSQVFFDILNVFSASILVTMLC